MNQYAVFNSEGLVGTLESTDIVQANHDAKQIYYIHDYPLTVIQIIDPAPLKMSQEELFTERKALMKTHQRLVESLGDVHNQMRFVAKLQEQGPALTDEEVHEKCRP